MKILMLAASKRKESFNKKLANITSKHLTTIGHEVDFSDFSEFDVPLYDGDIEDQSGIPPGAKSFIAKMQTDDAMIIVSPEYNFSIPGTLKNLIDWVSRAKPIPWARKPILLLSASPALAGGSRGLLATRVPLEICGAYVYPRSFSLAQADKAFTPENNLIDAELEKQLQKIVAGFLNFADTLSRKIE